MNVYLAIDSGGYVCRNNPRISRDVKIAFDWTGLPGSKMYCETNMPLVALFYVFNWSLSSAEVAVSYMCLFRFELYVFSLEQLSVNVTRIMTG